MNTLRLRTLSGYALVARGAACIVGGMAHPVVHGHAHSAEAVLSSREWLSFAGLCAGTILLVLGLPAVYGWLAPRMGLLGLAGYLLYLLGNLLSALPHVVVNALIAPEVARRAPDLISRHDLIIDSNSFAAEQVSTGIVLILGLFVFSVALLRSGLPRWIGACGIVGAVLLVLPGPAVAILSGIQVELLRGVMAIAIGLLAARSTLPTEDRDTVGIR